MKKQNIAFIFFVTAAATISSNFTFAVDDHSEPDLYWEQMKRAKRIMKSLLGKETSENDFTITLEPTQKDELIAELQELADSDEIDQLKYRDENPRNHHVDDENWPKIQPLFKLKTLILEFITGFRSDDEPQNLEEIFSQFTECINQNKAPAQGLEDAVSEKDYSGFENLKASISAGKVPKLSFEAIKNGADKSPGFIPPPNSPISPIGDPSASFQSTQVGDE